LLIILLVASDFLDS